MVVAGSKVQNFFHVATYVAEGRESYRSRVEVLREILRRGCEPLSKQYFPYFWLELPIIGANAASKNKKPCP